MAFQDRYWFSKKWSVVTRRSLPDSKSKYLIARKIRTGRKFWFQTPNLYRRSRKPRNVIALDAPKASNKNKSRESENAFTNALISAWCFSALNHLRRNRMPLNYRWRDNFAWFSSLVIAEKIHRTWLSTKWMEILGTYLMNLDDKSIPNWYKFINIVWAHLWTLTLLSWIVMATLELLRTDWWSKKIKHIKNIFVTGHNPECLGSGCDSGTTQVASSESNGKVARATGARHASTMENKDMAWHHVRSHCDSNQRAAKRIKHALPLDKENHRKSKAFTSFIISPTSGRTMPRSWFTFLLKVVGDACHPCPLFITIPDAKHCGALGSIVGAERCWKCLGQGVHTVSSVHTRPVQCNPRLGSQ